MSELRWTLLILGVVFIAALSWWERRRPRQAFAPRLRETGASSFGELPPREAQRSASPEPPVAGEPWIGEAGLSDVVSSDMEFTHTGEIRQLADDDALHAHVELPVRGPLDELPMLIIPDEDKRIALKAAWDEQPPEPTLIDPEAGFAVETAPPADTLWATDSASSEAPPAPASAPARVAAEPQHASSGALPVEPEIAGAEGVGAVRVVESGLDSDGAPPPPEPIVDWPPEESRRILALRLVASPTERFAGRALRMALAAEGFRLGRFAIFHKPDESNHAVLSAAALTRPGAFDLQTMDTQRYGGLSLFAVLPGPKPPAQAFEELLATARNLNERLEGALQDERGGPLTPLRVASIRDSLRAEAASPKAAAGQ